MIVAFEPKVTPGFVPCKEFDNGNGTVSIEKTNGKFLCVTPPGGIEERDTPGGVWESFKKGKNCLIAERDNNGMPAVYVLMAADA